MLILKSGPLIEANQRRAAKVFGFTFLEKMCRTHSNKYWKVHCDLPNAQGMVGIFNVPTLPPGMKSAYTWDNPGAYLSKFQPENFEQLPIDDFVAGPVPSVEVPGEDVEMTTPGPQATSDLNKTADTEPLSTSSRTHDSYDYENVANLSLSHDLGRDEVLQHFETLVTEDGKLPRDVAVKAMKYVHERIKHEATGKLEDARRRMQAELQEKLEHHQSNGAQAAADEKVLQEGLKAGTVLVNETQAKLKQLKVELRNAIDRKESAKADCQTLKAKHKSSLQCVIEHIVGETKEGWSHLRTFVKDNTGDPVGVQRESEAAEVPPPPACSRPFSQMERRQVTCPDLPAPAFIMEAEMPEWREMIKHRFRCWSETKRITTVLTDPVVVDLMQSLKGRPHMGGIFGSWSRATQGEQWDWMRWRDIKVSHLGWQRICHPMVARLPAGTKAIKESHAELVRVDKIINKVCHRLFGIKAEPAWTQHGLLDPQLNTADQAGLHDVPLLEWDEEVIKWMKGCQFSETELEDDEVFDDSNSPVTGIPKKTPPGGLRPGRPGSDSIRTAPRTSTSPIPSRLDDNNERVDEHAAAGPACDRQSRDDRYRQLNTPFFRASTPVRGGKRPAESMSGYRDNLDHEEDDNRGLYSRDSSTSSRRGHGKRGAKGPRGGPRQGVKRGGRGGSQGKQFPRGQKRGRGGGFASRGSHDNAPQAKQGRYRQ